MKHNKKTNAARRLDELKIEYRIMEYPVDEEHLDAVHVAAEVGMPAAQVFKTLVVRGDKNGIMFAVIPGDGELEASTAVFLSNTIVQIGYQDYNSTFYRKEQELLGKNQRCHRCCRSALQIGRCCNNLHTALTGADCNLRPVIARLVHIYRIILLRA